MRAVLVLFDTLTRKYLSPYSGREHETPNFERLAQRAVTFDNAYVGSMPCIPARRELHTGRSNFLHRSWGPLEPFDESMPALLSQAGVYTHLVTDHYHYFEDGGSNYHTKYTSWEIIRGQAGDPWRGRVEFDPPENVYGAGMFGGHWRQEWINREHLSGALPGVQTFDSGLDFIRENAGSDGWFLQIETFDPHEPFFLTQDEEAALAADERVDEFVWPPYRPITENDAEIRSIRGRYQQVVRRCDAQLGRILDAFDEHDLWHDTLLIVGTDHGLLLGEHGWWGKTGPRSRTGPAWFNEIAHVPLFVAGGGLTAERVAAITSFTDIPVTLLDWFGAQAPESMQGRSLLTDRVPPRDGHIFGSFGGHVNVTDGRYVYMRSNETEQPELHEYTLVPYRLSGAISAEEMADATLSEQSFSFTGDYPLLKVPVASPLQLEIGQHLLFDVQADPEQVNPLDDRAVEQTMIDSLVSLMAQAEAPPEQYQRLGLRKPSGPSA